jgi:DNA-directed RNA polymerase subunit RPC12/RpoP
LAGVGGSRRHLAAIVVRLVSRSPIRTAGANTRSPFPSDRFGMISAMDKRFLENCLAEGMSLERIGELTGKHPSIVGYWLKKHGLKANRAETFSPRGGIPREILEVAVEEALTLSEMAEELDRSISTVRYWLKRYGLEATGGSRRRGTREAKRLGLRHIERRCQQHGRTMFVLENRGSYRCMKCRAENVSAWRRRAKRLLVEEAGGKCRRCGYDRYLGGLHFHHLDSATKSFGLSLRGRTRSIAELRAEAAKCILLCGNCHAEVENGLAEVP